MTPRGRPTDRPTMSGISGEEKLSINSRGLTKHEKYQWRGQTPWTLAPSSCTQSLKKTTL